MPNKETEFHTRRFGRWPTSIIRSEERGSDGRHKAGPFCTATIQRMLFSAGSILPSSTQSHDMFPKMCGMPLFVSFATVICSLCHSSTVNKLISHAIKLRQSMRQVFTHLCQLIPGNRCVRVFSMDRFLRCVMDHYNVPPPPLHFCDLLSRGHCHGRSVCQQSGIVQRRFLLFDVGGVYTQSWARKKKTPMIPSPGWRFDPSARFPCLPVPAWAATQL